MGVPLDVNRRDNVAMDLDIPFQSAKSVTRLAPEWSKLDKGLAVLGDDDYIAGLGDLVHQFQAFSLKF